LRLLLSQARLHDRKLHADTRSGLEHLLCKRGASPGGSCIAVCLYAAPFDALRCALDPARFDPTQLLTPPLQLSVTQAFLNC